MERKFIGQIHGLTTKRLYCGCEPF